MSSIMLMDEPFSGLDPIAKKKTLNVIQRVADLDEMNTLVIVTHDIAAVATVADHIWLMGRDRDSGGKILSGAHIVETYNLLERDLAWHPDIEKTREFTDFVLEVTERFKTL